MKQPKKQMNSMKQIRKLSELEFNEEVKTRKWLVVDFGADWCPPCKALEPILLELQESFTEITFAKVEVDKEETLAARFAVKSLPTLLFFKNGQLTETMIGYRPKKQYEKSLNELMEE